MNLMRKSNPLWPCLIYRPWFVDPVPDPLIKVEFPYAFLGGSARQGTAWTFPWKPMQKLGQSV